MKMAYSISHKIVKNTLFNAAGRFWGILIGLLLTPYIIRHLGLEKYGILTLVGATTGYFGLLDFGIGASFVKYIAEFHVDKDSGKINQLIVTGFLFYSALAFFFAGLSLFVAKPLALLLKTRPDLYPETVIVFVIGIITFGLSNALSVFAAIQSGLQRMDISNKVGMGMSVINALGTVFCLENAHGLIGLMLLNAGMVIIGGACNIIIAYRIMPGLSLGFRNYSGAMFGKMFRLGYKMQVN